MPADVTTQEGAFEYIDALRDRLDSIEFERLAQGLPKDPWRSLSLARFRVNALHMESALENEGMTALNRLRFDEFVRELAQHGIDDDDSTPCEPSGHYSEPSEILSLRKRVRELDGHLREARRQVYRHSDEEVLAALRTVDTGSTSASMVADHLWRGDAPHHFVVRVGLALSRLRRAGLVEGTPSHPEKSWLPLRWKAVLDAA